MNTNEIKKMGKSLYIEILDSIKTYTPMKESISKTFYKYGKEYHCVASKTWRHGILQMSVDDIVVLVIIQDIFSGKRLSMDRDDLYNRIKSSKKVKIYPIVHNTVFAPRAYDSVQNFMLLTSIRSTPYVLCIKSFECNGVAIELYLTETASPEGIKNRIITKVTLSQDSTNEVTGDDLKKYLTELAVEYSVYRKLDFLIAHHLYRGEKIVKNVIEINDPHLWIYKIEMIIASLAGDI